MTEQEWLDASDPKPMLCFLLGTSHIAMAHSTPRTRKSKVSDRTLRRFACACYLRLRGVLPHPFASAAVDVAERFAEDPTLNYELHQVNAEVYREYGAFEPRWRAAVGSERVAALPTHAALTLALQATRPDAGLSAWYSCSNASWTVGPTARRGISDSDPMFIRAESDEKAAQAELLRDLVGPSPFHPLVFDTSWLTSTVVLLAQGIYEEKAFDRMPILADCLMDEGCNDDDILNHLRGPGPHFKGCWALDMILGKN